MIYLKTYFYYFFLLIKFSFSPIKIIIINNKIHKIEKNDKNTTTVCFINNGWILHREDNNPSIKTENYEKWFKFGKEHRENLPAYIYCDWSNFEIGDDIIPLGEKYYLNGIEITKKAMQKHMLKSKIEEF